MYELRLNNLSVRVKRQEVTLFDVFGDVSDAEIENVIAYLVYEGFLNQKKEVDVFVKSKSIIPARARKTSQKKD